MMTLEDPSPCEGWKNVEKRVSQRSNVGVFAYRMPKWMFLVILAIKGLLFESKPI